MIATDQRQRRKALKRLLELPPELRAENLRDDRIKAALDGIESAQAESKVADWARRAGREDEYRLAYMFLSSDVHSSLRAIEAHLRQDDEGKVVGLTALPNTDQIPFLLCAACDSFLHVLVTLPHPIVTAEHAQRATDLFGDRRKRRINDAHLAVLEREDDSPAGTG